MKRASVAMMAALLLGILVSPAAAQDGAKVYADQKCSVCHAIAGKGNAKGALDNVGTKLTADEIRQWIVDPVGMTAKAKATRKPAMTAKYASLPKPELDALVTYLSSLKGK